MNAPSQVVSLLSDQLGAAEIDWNAVRDTLEAHPRAALSLHIAKGLNILHLACCRTRAAPLSVVELLVRQYPNAIREKDIDGALPLHTVCVKGKAFEVFQFLIQKHPNGVKIFR